MYMEAVKLQQAWNHLKDADLEVLKRIILQLQRNLHDTTTGSLHRTLAKLGFCFCEKQSLIWNLTQMNIRSVTKMTN